MIMSKKKFEAPKAEIFYIEATDVLTTSTDSFDGAWVPIGASDNAESGDFLAP